MSIGPNANYRIFRYSLSKKMLLTGIVMSDIWLIGDPYV
jgi:hypothetical protein